MAIVAITVRFLVELAGVGAFAYWGLQAPIDGWARIALAIGAGLVFAVFWGRVVAPRATNRLTQQQRDVVGTAVLLLAAGALAIAGQPVLALAFAAIVVVDWLALVVLGPEAIEVVRPTAARSR
jgi:Protein of unknown function (DUF2568)